MSDKGAKTSPNGSDDELDPRGSSSSLTVENVRLHTEQTKKKRSDSQASSTKETQPLAPLKTQVTSTRSSVADDITSLGASTVDEQDLNLPKTKPLPPIGSKDKKAKSKGNNL